MAHAEHTTWTAADLAALPDDAHYELVKGQLVRRYPVSKIFGTP